MKYEILGMLRIVEAEQVSLISAPKMEVLLAVLLARAGQSVTTGQLMSEIWGEQPPKRANAALYVYICQLRKLLGRPLREESPIVTRPVGYQLRLAPGDEIDAHTFTGYVDEGRVLAGLGRHDEAIKRFEAALALWRGPALQDVRDGAVVYAYATWLEEVRLECMEMLTEAYLAMGRHRETVGRLYSLTAEYPLREAFYRHLMLALYRSERQAEALEVYRSAHEKLGAELGLEPCRPLRDLHQAILAGDEQLYPSAV